MTTIRIGICGWRHGPWRGVFYPEGPAQHRELEHASRPFRSIETNGTFYRPPDPGFFGAGMMRDFPPCPLPP